MINIFLVIKQTLREYSLGISIVTYLVTFQNVILNAS